MNALAPPWLKLLFIVLLIFIVGSIALIAWRSHENDNRCQATLGPGASYYSKNMCSPPPVRVSGLL